MNIPEEAAILVRATAQQLIEIASETDRIPDTLSALVAEIASGEPHADVPESLARIATYSAGVITGIAAASQTPVPELLRGLGIRDVLEWIS